MSPNNVKRAQGGTGEHSAPCSLRLRPFMQICFLCIRETKMDLGPSHIVLISELLSLKCHGYCCALLKEVRKGEGKGWHARMHSRVTACADLNDTADSFNSWYMRAESLESSLIQIPIYCEKGPENKTTIGKRIQFAAILILEAAKCAPDINVPLVGRCSCTGSCLQSITSSYTDRRH